MHTADSLKVVTTLFSNQGSTNFYFLFWCSVDQMTTEDYVALATFLGEQVRLLHALPLPATLLRTTWAQKTTRLPGRGPPSASETSGISRHGSLVNGSDKIIGGSTDAEGVNADVPSEWHYFVGLLRQQRANALERFEDW